MVPREMVKISDTLWELPSSHKPGMRVPARFYATEGLLRAMDPAVFEQAANVATLPGIVGYSFCLPDGHSGYGFPIGGVAAFDPDKGVISPGGIGFDINCGMRLVATSLTWPELRAPPARAGGPSVRRHPRRGGLARASSRSPATSSAQMSEQGLRWCLKKGWAWKEDLERTEEGGVARGGRRLGGEREGRGARLPADRHPGLGQPLPGNPGGPRREHLRPQAGRGAGHPGPRAGAGDVPLRQPRLRPPGGHRLSVEVPGGDAAEVPHPLPGPRAGQRPLRLRGGAGLLRGHEVRGEHVLRQPPGDPAPPAGGVRRGVRPRPAGAGHAPGLRRHAQHRATGEARASGGAQAARAPGAPQGGHARPGPRQRGPAARPTAAAGSR